MLAKNKNAKVSYVSRLVVLPLVAIVFFAFTLKVKTIASLLPYDGKTFTVVIDAGHGGEDDGAVSANGLREKDINLSIAKKVAALNQNNNIKILLTRDNDKSISVRDRVEFAAVNHADIFLSIHVNAEQNVKSGKSGFSVLIDKNNNDKNKLLASSLINELKKSYLTEGQIGLRTNNVGVLDNNLRPAAIIECGYLTNSADAAFISKEANQVKVARNILDAVVKYAGQLKDSKESGIQEIRFLL